MLWVVRKVARSPHLVEVFLSCGAWMVLMACTSVAEYHVSWMNLVLLTLSGTMFYTFIEYWFHRVILHQWLKMAHDNHHRLPRNLRIIATPILPVQIYGLLTMVVSVYALGRKIAYPINGGVALGQITMDTVHVLFHSDFRPWYLESARSYHLFHHFADEDVAHGLTTSFWDMVFGTLPDNWYVYKKYPWMRYIQVPFPLVNFIIISLLIGDTTKQQDTTSDTAAAKQKKSADYRSHGTVSDGPILMSWMVVLGAWYVITRVGS